MLIQVIGNSVKLFFMKKKIIILIIWFLSSNVYCQNDSRYLKEFTSYAINLAFYNTPSIASKFLDTTRTYMYKGDCVGAVKFLLGKRSDEIRIVGQLPDYSLMTFDFYGVECGELHPTKILLRTIEKRYDFRIVDTVIFMPTYVISVVDSNKLKGFITPNLVGGSTYLDKDDFVVKSTPISTVGYIMGGFIDKLIISDTSDPRVSFRIPFNILKNEEVLREYIRTHIGISIDKKMREVKVTQMIFN